MTLLTHAGSPDKSRHGNPNRSTTSKAFATVVKLTIVGRGDDAVLLVHGFNNSPRLWDFIAQELAEQGYHCRAMRLPGFAMTNEQYARSTIEDWIEAVQEEVATLKASHGRVHLVAH